MGELKLETESIDTAEDCSKQSVPGPAGLFIPGDPTAGNIDPTNPDERVPGGKGTGKSKPANSSTG